MDDIQQPPLSTAEVDVSLAALKGERVTVAGMLKRIVEVDYIRIRETVTVCSIALDNGYSVRGESACVDPANYQQEVGERLAYDDAFRKLWPLFGFMLAEARFQAAA